MNNYVVILYSKKYGTDEFFVRDVYGPMSYNTAEVIVKGYKADGRKVEAFALKNL